ncbi:MAG: SAM-dependent DNA methyltransferase, partial [Gemmatimonadetes bacterium]|nr:SAM-dependent DNA methyltransferase [Gemmatimonadota bacterium]
MTNSSLYKVLSVPGGAESNVELELIFALRELGYTSAETQYQTGAGPVDIAVPDQGIFVEVKNRGEVGPDLPGRQKDETGTHETQKDQLTRYVRAWQKRERNRAQRELFISTEISSAKPACGVLTDGRLWWVWRFPDEGVPYLETVVSLSPGQEILLETLLRVLGDPGARAVPKSAVLASQLKPRREHLGKLYRDMERWDEVRTKFRVWKDLLRASGMPPQDEHAAEQFVDHTFLVVLARVVAGLLADAWDGPPDPARRESFPVWVREGFPAWVWESDTGSDWVADLYAANALYDWRRAPGDLLRDLYVEMVDKSHREVFGEYYTPDWLAVELTVRVLDNQWMDTAAEKVLTPGASEEALAGTGVLDPVCGSGTFLFHAARCILAHLEKDSYLTDRQRADAVVRLVHGLDIHPVAVEMARATLLSALPTAPTAGRDALQIFQGDALRVSRQSDAGLFREGGQYSLVPTGNTQDFEIPLPLAFLKRPDRIKAVQDFVASADQSDALPRHLTYGLSPDDRAELEAAHQSLTDICLEMGDSIWAWYILNTVAPYLLAERKVDRILANPPWVRMSKIQDTQRKSEMRDLAENLHLWVGGQRATSFDIAQIFAVRCSELYLPLSDTRNWGGRTAWLVNAASLRTDSWKRFRERVALRNARCLDFSSVKVKPFHGAHCAAWLTGADNAVLDRQRLVMRSEERIRRQDAWETIAAKVRWEAMPDPPPEEPSAWLNDQSKPLARNGATVFPQVLVRIATEHDINGD